MSELPSSEGKMGMGWDGMGRDKQIKLNKVDNIDDVSLLLGINCNIK